MPFFILALVLVLVLILIVLVGLLVLVVLIGLILILVLVFHVHFLRNFVLRQCRFRSIPKVLRFILGFENQTC